MKNWRTKEKHSRGYGGVVWLCLQYETNFISTYDSVDAEQNCLCVKKKTTARYDVLRNLDSKETQHFVLDHHIFNTQCQYPWPVQCP